MSRPAAFQGSYSDLKFYKSRSVAAITVEIPIEQAAAFVAAFGAPTPGAEIPVAIARLDPAKPPSEYPKPAEPMPAPKERRRFDTLGLAQQAALRCNDQAFRRFLAEREGAPGTPEVFEPEIAASVVRNICGVETRADIRDEHPSGMRWRTLETEFRNWMIVP